MWHLWKQEQQEVGQHWFIDSYIAAYIQVQYRVTGVHPTGLTVARGAGRCPQHHDFFEVSFSVLQLHSCTLVFPAFFSCNNTTTWEIQLPSARNIWRANYWMFRPENPWKKNIYVMRFWGPLARGGTGCVFFRPGCTTTPPQYRASVQFSVFLLLLDYLKKFISLQRRTKKMWNHFPSFRFTPHLCMCLCWLATLSCFGHLKKLKFNLMKFNKLFYGGTHISVENNPRKAYLTQHVIDLCFSISVFWLILHIKNMNFV